MGVLWDSGLVNTCTSAGMSVRSDDRIDSPLGSSLHAVRTFENPRWEDYDFKFLDPPQSEKGEKGKPNRWYWLGDGSTYNEKTMTGDRAWYLDPGYLDIPPGTIRSLPLG